MFFVCLELMLPTIPCYITSAVNAKHAVTFTTANHVALPYFCPTPVLLKCILCFDWCMFLDDCWWPGSKSCIYPQLSGKYELPDWLQWLTVRFVGLTFFSSPGHVQMCWRALPGLQDLAHMCAGKEVPFLLHFAVYLCTDVSKVSQSPAETIIISAHVCNVILA